MEIKLIKPFSIDGEEVTKIDLKLDDLTGSEMLKIDSELRTEGHVGGLSDVFNQNVLLRIASKASGIHTDDLAKLKAPDFLEVTFTVRSFLLGSSGTKADQENSEESSSH